MRKNILSLVLVTLGATALTSCIQEVEPQSSTVTTEQASNAPGSFDNFVSTVTSEINGKASYYPSAIGSYKWDFGYPSQMLARDVMGQDIVLNPGKSSFMYWYSSSRALGPQYMVCQVPWTVYYGWIKNCNTVISLAGENPDDSKKSGAGIAYAMRALFYQDMAQMFAQKTYGQDKDAETVPIVTEDASIDYTHNPRATNEKMWNFILSDLDKAEQYLADYKRTDKTTPDLSVVYGLKARAYLVMCDWANAEKYAKLAQEGYSVMTEDEYTSRETGFNTPTNSWMMCVTYKSDDPCLKNDDCDTSWGSQMSLEIDPNASGCGYASNYGDSKSIDYHLYNTIPSTDFRKKCFIDFSVDNMTSSEKLEKIGEYSDYPSWIVKSASKTGYGPGGFSLKFRTANGVEGHTSQYKGFLQSVPLMRVEEMKLIEAEAAGMQDEARGIQLLTAFAKTRDAQYVYGQHNEAYGNTNTSAFQNEIWWQRRVELWGEGFSTFDIKRLNKGIIRSYANTNHMEDYRWNTTSVPQWMTYCIVQTETNYNYDCTQNPTPSAPTEDSEEYVW